LEAMSRMDCNLDRAVDWQAGDFADRKLPAHALVQNGAHRYDAGAQPTAEKVSPDINRFDMPLDLKLYSCNAGGFLGYPPRYAVLAIKNQRRGKSFIQRYWRCERF